MRIFNVFRNYGGMILVVLVAAFFLLSYKHLVSSNWLQFSDSAKFADIARNVFLNKGLGKSFNFFNTELETIGTNKLFTTTGVPIANPMAIYLSFKIFGLSDQSVTYVSMISYILSVIFIYLLGSKIFNKTSGTVGAILFASNLSMLAYAVSGASESLFILEIVMSFYFIAINKPWSVILSLLVLVLMYLTRPMAFIFLLGALVFWMTINFGVKKSIKGIFIVCTLALIFDWFILYPLSFKTPIYSVISRGQEAVLHYPSGVSTSYSLRGGITPELSYQEVAKKVFYNVYNFYKLLPEIISPYIFALFLINLFIWGKSKLEDSFKFASIVVVLLSIFAVAITIPLIRYLHPIIPFVYLLAAEMLTNLVSTITKKKLTTLLILSFIILFFSLGQSLGKIFLDSRFEKKMYNVGKAPVYVLLSTVLKDKTNENSTVLTNLDTWGTWYGERKTVWYPIDPKLITNIDPSNIPFDYIYLTNYLIDDENYAMNQNWRMIFDNPNSPDKWVCDGCKEIANQYKLEGIYKIDPASNYENKEGLGVLLVKQK